MEYALGTCLMELALGTCLMELAARRGLTAYAESRRYPIELGAFPPTLADGRLVGLRNRRYGRTVLALYVCRPSGRSEALQPFPEEFV